MAYDDIDVNVSLPLLVRFLSKRGLKHPHYTTEVSTVQRLALYRPKKPVTLAIGTEEKVSPNSICFEEETNYQLNSSALGTCHT